MPTYEYECEVCGVKFDIRQAITEAPLSECPECRGKVRRLVSGGSGFMLKGSGQGRMESGEHACSLERTGKTCCGRESRCEKPSCGPTA